MWCKSCLLPTGPTRTWPTYTVQRRSTKLSSPDTKIPYKSCSTTRPPCAWMKRVRPRRCVKWCLMGMSKSSVVCSSRASRSMPAITTPARHPTLRYVQLCVRMALRQDAMVCSALLAHLSRHLLGSMHHHHQAAEGNVVALKMLLEFGADLTLTDRWNNTATDGASSSVKEFLRDLTPST
jgi:hypothetical protein